MGRRRLATLLAATLASGMIALPASALSLGEVTDGATSIVKDSSTTVVEDAVDTIVDEVVDAVETVAETTSTVLEATGLDEVVPTDDVEDVLAPVTDLLGEGEPAPQDEQNRPAPANPTPTLSTPSRSANDVVTASAPSPGSDDAPSAVRPAPLPGDGAPATTPTRTEQAPAAQVAPPAPIAAPRLDAAPGTRAPELAVPVAQTASDAWLKTIASLMVLGTAGVWHRAQRSMN